LDRMVPAGTVAAYENKLVAVKEPGNLASKPATAIGTNADELLDAVDQVHNYMLAASRTKNTEHQAGLLNDAAKVYEKWTIRHPDQVNQWGAMAQWRSGHTQFIKPKPEAEMDKEIAKAIKGDHDPSMWWIASTEKPTKPGYALDRSTPEALQRSLNDARADMAGRFSEWIFLNAWAQGRPIIKGQIMLPGEVAFNARVRARVAPIRNRLMGAEGRIGDYLNDVKAQHAAQNVHFDGSLDRLGALFVGKTSGEWIKANYTQKWSATLEKIASRFGLTYSGHEVVFASPESVKTMQRAGLAHMPRRMAQVLAINYAKAGPAERRMFVEQWQEMLAEAAHFNSSPLAVKSRKFWL